MLKVKDQIILLHLASILKLIGGQIIFSAFFVISKQI